ncbi:hypothetical protein EV702DRAFT_1101902 [Suillus placidus]|uniref:THO1-MOS11 C-terminal domain-containing protein n=1 Tax=Suillus placidus TaxID=48579 RepID=A0A9P6ZVR0_9AGAM|nr:hypothetical protein EV702DRAFT_1101902 [Suillus placidus]
METKLKALKVQELKEILSKASIPPGNAKKQDLINKILANPSAIDLFHSLHPKHKNSKPVLPPSTDDDLLAPPEEIDWTVEESVPVEPASPPKKSEPPLPSPAPALAAVPPAPVQSEEEKRKARAARFGTTYVEPIQQQPKKAASENPDKLKARSERFGTVASVTKFTRKRASPVENVDPEEQERRRKRAERFGLPLSGKA